MTRNYGSRQLSVWKQLEVNTSKDDQWFIFSIFTLHDDLRCGKSDGLIIFFCNTIKRCFTHFNPSLRIFQTFFTRSVLRTLKEGLSVEGQTPAFHLVPGGGVSPVWWGSSEKVWTCVGEGESLYDGGRRQGDWTRPGEGEGVPKWTSLNRSS